MKKTIIIYLILLSMIACAQNKNILKTSTHYVGRISFELPKGYKLESQESQIYSVDISSVKLESKSKEEHWQLKLKEIKEQGGSNLEEVTNIKDISFVFYEKTNSIGIYALGQMSKGESVATVSYQGRKDKKNIIIKLVKGVLTSYQDGFGTGFNFGNGHLTSDVSSHERTGSSFLGPENVGIQIITTTNHGNNYDFTSNIREVEDLGFEVLKKEKRKVNGIKGFELVILYSENNAKGLMYKWIAIGDVNNSKKPEITIETTIPYDSKETFDRHWETILNTLEYIE